MTDQSMLCHVKHVVAKQKTTPASVYVKPGKRCMESIAKKATLLCGLAGEVLAQVPIPEKAVQEYWVDAWCNGATHIDFELSSVLLDKNDGFDVNKGLAVVEHIVDDHVCAALVKSPVGAPEHPMMFVRDAFDLFIKQCSYDEKVFDTWKEMPQRHRS